MSAERLRYSPTGHAVILPGDDIERAVDEMIRTGYREEFCLSPSFDPRFISALMASGFLVMSMRAGGTGIGGDAILLPKLHLQRAVLELASMHVGRSVRRLLPRYRLGVNEAFPTVMDNCVTAHGDDWITEELRSAFTRIRESEPEDARPDIPFRPRAARIVSFELYRGDRLVAGEFGVAIGGVYTSYSGYREESSAGTIQMVLAGRYLRQAGFAMWDLGMPMNYKEGLGARSISREAFVERFRAERDRPRQPVPSATTRA